MPPGYRTIAAASSRSEDVSITQQSAMPRVTSRPRPSVAPASGDNRADTVAHGRERARGGRGHDDRSVGACTPRRGRSRRARPRGRGGRPRARGAARRERAGMEAGSLRSRRRACAGAPPRWRRDSAVRRRTHRCWRCSATTTRGSPRRPRTRSASTRARRVAPSMRSRPRPRRIPTRSCARPRSRRSARSATPRRCPPCSPAATTSPRSGGARCSRSPRSTAPRSKPRCAPRSTTPTGRSARPPKTCSR